MSLLNDYFYCPRRASLKAVEGWRAANQHTARGDIVHEQVDTAGYETVRGATLIRALPVYSDRLGLSGKCDIVEKWPDGTLVPVEFKVGKRREFENDDAQLCAQALCLEEMFRVSIAHGAIYHAASKRRREVELTSDLRRSTETAIADLHRIAQGVIAVAAKYMMGRCEECSLFNICLPVVTGESSRIERDAAALFQIPKGEKSRAS